MDNQTTGVETKIETAPTQQGEASTQPAAPVDYQAVLSQKEEELNQIRKERDNYKKGMLKAKGKTVDDHSDSDDQEDQESVMRRIAREEFLSTQEARLLAERDETIAAMAKRNRELETALKNRSQVTQSTSFGSTADKGYTPPDNFFSTDQLNEFRKKGYDDAKIERIKRNMQRPQVPNTN